MNHEILNNPEVHGYKYCEKCNLGGRSSKFNSGCKLCKGHGVRKKTKAELKKKKKHDKNMIVVNMLKHTKPGPHPNIKKESSKKACRGKVDDDKE